jgi:hypothetical protein
MGCEVSLRLFLPLVLATTALLPDRISAQDEPPSVLKSVGVTAAEVGVGLGVSVLGEYGCMVSQIPAVSYTVLALTPPAAAAGVYGIGSWLDRGGSFGPAVLGGYVGAAAGIASGIAWYFLVPSGDEWNGFGLSLVGFPIGCAIGSVIGYKLSRRSPEEEASHWQLIPPSVGLALKRPATGRPMEIAGVKVNLVGARF